MKLEVGDMRRSRSKRLSRKGSLKRGGIESVGGDDGEVVEIVGGGVGSLHCGVDEMEE